MSWHVFYTPHTDDESIGMGGSIARARAEGHDVLVVLVTENRPSAYMERVWEREDLPAQRRFEWARAMRTLGVTEIREWEIAECDSPFVMQALIEVQMEAVIRELDPVCHHTVWGINDVHVGAGYGSLSHVACAGALSRIALRYPVRARLHGVYVYSMLVEERRAPGVAMLTEAEMEQKRAALRCYMRDETDPLSIGYGHRSVSELIDAAMSDPREFIMEVPHGDG